MRNGLRLLQNPPTCAPVWRVLSSARRCPSAIGFGSPDFQAHDYTFGRFFRLCFYGGHAWGAFERAGSLDRSTNLRMAATFRLVAKVMAPYLQENHQC
ncbi:hypothetical protein EMIT0P218_60197 [Pseudomonas sp. IT-P218]